MGSETATIRAVKSSDSAAMAAIYNHYVAETVVTFEEEPIDGDEMARRIETVRSASLPWLVAEENGQVAGYAYASPWKVRSAYRFSVEITVYLAPGNVGRGIGFMLCRLSSPLCRRMAFTQSSEGSHSPTRPASLFMKNSGLRKLPTLNKSDSS